LVFDKLLNKFPKNPVVLDFIDHNVPGTNYVLLDNVELWGEAISLDKVFCLKLYLFFTDVLSLALSDRFKIHRHSLTYTLVQLYVAFSTDARFPINIDLFIRVLARILEAFFARITNVKVPRAPHLLTFLGQRMEEVLGIAE
jgi:hypothetical protein